MSPLFVVFDFDSSITTHDTTHCLALSAVSAAAAADRRAALGAWEYVRDAYAADPARAAHVAAYRPAEAERTTVAQELAYLESHRRFDLASAGRCASSGLFRYLPAERERVRQLGRDAARRALRTTSEEGEEEQEGQEQDEEEGRMRDERSGDYSPAAAAPPPPPRPRPAVQIRDGFHDFAAAMSARGCRLGLLSVSFSLAFVEGVLGDDAAALFGERCANEIQPSTREIVGPSGSMGGGAIMATPGDKTRALRMMCERERAAAREDGEDEELKEGKGDGPRLVYIGDSTTDLGCLTECADLGIVMVAQDEQDPAGGNGELMRCLRRLGFEVPHVSEHRRPLGGATGEEQAPRMLWARDFNEISQSGVLEDI